MQRSVIPETFEPGTLFRVQRDMVLSDWSGIVMVVHDGISLDYPHGYAHTINPLVHVGMLHDAHGNTLVMGLRGDLTIVSLRKYVETHSAWEIK